MPKPAYETIKIFSRQANLGYMPEALDTYLRTSSKDRYRRVCPSDKGYTTPLEEQAIEWFLANGGEETDPYWYYHLD